MIESIQTFAAKQALRCMEQDPDKSFSKLLDWVDKFDTANLYQVQRKALRAVLEHPENNWYQLARKVFQLDAGVRETFLQNFILNASLIGGARQQAVRLQERCNVPWAILLDATSARTGCRAAQHGNPLSLGPDEIDRIVQQGKSLGIYIYIYTGGEPLMRKEDRIRLCELHSDCEFLAFTDGTGIDEAFCQEMLRVKNFVPAIRLKGFADAKDRPRDAANMDTALAAMRLLKAHKLPFGCSVCYTSANWDAVTSEEFFDLLVDAGALFAWFFHYLPVGNAAAPERTPAPEQRAAVYTRLRRFRETKPVFSIDPQNDAEYVGGCMAGGRHCLHINAAGDVEPCVFLHYSNVNIHDCSLLEALKSPLFLAFHDNQPFHANMLRSCPLLNDPQTLEEMVARAGARSTDLRSPESVEHLCDKCRPYAEAWASVADALWRKGRDKTAL